MEKAHAVYLYNYRNMPTVFHKTVGEIENITGCIHQLKTEIIPSNIAFLEEQMVEETRNIVERDGKQCIN